MKMNLIALSIFMLPNWAIADTTTPGLHAGLLDCVHMLTRPDTEPFPKAAEIEGDVNTGFVAWYHDPSEKPIYAVRLGFEGDVAICSGPEPMGPFVADFEVHDKLRFENVANELNLLRLNVPVAGLYFAECAADIPRLFLAVTIDATQRVGFKLISSPDVVESCRKFGL